MTGKRANRRFYLSLAMVTFVTVLSPLPVPASVLFIGDKHSVLEYTTDGKVVDAVLVTGLNYPGFIAASRAIKP